MQKLTEMRTEGQGVGGAWSAGEVRLALRRGMTAGWTGRLVGWLRREARPRPRLALLEKIALAPKQSLALVEADGRRFLVASSAEGTPAFYPLGAPTLRRGVATRARVSW